MVTIDLNNYCYCGELITEDNIGAYWLIDENGDSGYQCKTCYDRMVEFNKCALSDEV